MHRSKALIAVTVSVGLTLLGVGAASAQGGDVARVNPATAPTTVPVAPDDFTQMFEILTFEQLGCLISNVGAFGAEDLGAMFDVLTDCGVSIDQLLEIGQATIGEVTIGDEPAASPPKPVGDDLLSVDDVLAVLGLGTADLECIENGLQGVVPVTGDEAALGLLEDCDLSLLDLLQGLVTLGAVDVTDDTVEEIPADDVTPTAPTTPDEAPGGIVDMFIDELDDLGFNVDSDQAQCLLDSMSSLDFEDLSASLQVFEECGISLTDLLGG